jgi:hypothetical protein
MEDTLFVMLNKNIEPCIDQSLRAGKAQKNIKLNQFRVIGVELNPPHCDSKSRLK